MRNAGTIFYTRIETFVESFAINVQKNDVFWNPTIIS